MYNLTDDSMNVLKTKIDKVDRLFQSLEQTKVLSEKGRILQQLQKEIEWCKNQSVSLKHDIKSCP